MQNEAYPPMPERRRFPVLKVIATVLLIMILICGGLVTYVAYNMRGWMVRIARGPLVSMVDEAGLPDEQKASIKQNLNRLADEFEAGRISYTQFTSIVEKLSQGPFFELIQVEAMKHQYGLAHPQNDQAQQDTLVMFDRFARGVAERSIPAAEVQKVLALSHDPDETHADGSKQVTEAELRPFIDAMIKAVEAAKIPVEPFQPDYAGEIDKAVNAVLGPSSPTTSTAPAATQPAEMPLPESASAE